MDCGEDAEAAAQREAFEELGIELPGLQFLYSYRWRSDVESELIRSYSALCEGPFVLQSSEIEEGRFWSLDEVERCLGQGIFTPNFEHEWPRAKKALNETRFS